MTDWRLGLLIQSQVEGSSLLLWTVISSFWATENTVPGLQFIGLGSGLSEKQPTLGYHCHAADFAPS